MLHLSPSSPSSCLFMWSVKFYSKGDVFKLPEHQRPYFWILFHMTQRWSSNSRVQFITVVGLLFVPARPADQSRVVLDECFYVLCQTKMLMLKNTEYEHFCSVNTMMTRTQQHIALLWWTLISLMAHSQRHFHLSWIINLWGFFFLSKVHNLAEAHSNHVSSHDLSRWPCPITIISIFNL